MLSQAPLKFWGKIVMLNWNFQAHQWPSTARNPRRAPGELGPPLLEPGAAGGENWLQNHEKPKSGGMENKTKNTTIATDQLLPICNTRWKKCSA